ncbi:TetR family transcriptional regulator [Streptomyces sp. NTH33]|uniref:TetR family transcriptional regulator n=1 Tax=Streptomyces sp. NTH33 TaxID=1735453 RepID=UPI000DA89085|nr:TetR family transcriptional regulator [Streptomyces sp. NTH33]PZH20061.1 TetR family transcriptional regulator [Streptomyces sp. NTH33]
MTVARASDNTTVDDIVRRAGVGRRSFFRYFPTKEEVVFPDHERALADMVEYLEEGAQDPDPVGRACGAARLVMRTYAENTEFSVKRYALTRRVAALKAHEISVVWRYEHALAAYLKRRFASLPDGDARAYTVAASVVAAHNYGLRTWLRSGARGDVAAGVDQALDLVRRTWGDTGETLVLVARSSTPLWQIVQRLEGIRPDSSHRATPGMGN